MAKYPIKMLLDELKRPFFPLVTIDTIVTNNSDKTLKELFEDRYTKAEVDKIISDLGTLQRLRGTVNSYEELLAIENPMPGDTYILLVESGVNAEYMYIGDRWEMLGTTATYTDVYSKEVIDEMLLELKQEINTKSELDDAEVLAQAKLYAEDLFANVPRPNLDDYYKKAEADAKIDEKINAIELPIASTDTLGVVKVGANLSIDADGILSANSGGTTEPSLVNVVDNLTSTSTTDALSANMGRELNEKIKNIDVLEEYSTEEKVIGKWVDGEILYEKTFITTSKTIDLSGLNYDTLLITYFGMYVSNYIMTPYYTSSSDYLKILVTDQKQLTMITSHTSFTKAIMVIQYTKKA